MSVDPAPSNQAGPSRLPIVSDPLNTPHSEPTTTTPSSVFAYSIAGGFIGFVLGAKRGGSRARLRFLAENAHRPPKTKQGWYYYLRARNYLMIKSGTVKGLKYASILGTGTGIYAVLDEYVGYYREQLGDHVPREISDEDMGRYTWRQGQVRLYDGTIAGGILGTAIGLLWRLPRTLFYRSIILGISLGTLESALQLVRDKMESRAADEFRENREKRAVEQAERERAEEEPLTDAQREKLRMLKESGQLSPKERRKVVGEMKEENRLKNIARETSAQRVENGGDGARGWFSWK